MPFNTILFVLFLFVFVLVYYSVKSQTLQSTVLLAGSLLFYLYFYLANFLYLTILILYTYLVATRLKKSRNDFLLLLSIFFILFVLFSGKYISTLFSSYLILNLPDFSYFNLFVVPIGISFYTLQAISLLIDINNASYRADTSLVSISLYLSFFPQSISGPIHRANELIPQFSDYKKHNSEGLIIGFKTMLWGYFCKLLIADKLSLIVSPVFSSVADYDGGTIFIATLLFSIQIYFDFMGYSLIAIGIGRLLGYKINVNFNKPYSSRSIKEFWRRWHITLSKWMRDYIYIPLGGKKQKHYLFFVATVFITFTLSGFWHGPSFNFILWGAVHSILYLTENFITGIIPIKRILFPEFLKKICLHVLFFITISLTWLIFRTENINDLIMSFCSIIAFWKWSGHDTFNIFFSSINLFYLSIFLLTLFFNGTRYASQFIEYQSITFREKILESAITCVLLFLLFLFGDIGAQEFLYFKF